MASCERCWADAHGDAEQYLLLLQERPPCTPEQQAGAHAAWCPVCGRKTVHQLAKVCTACCPGSTHDMMNGTK